MATTGGLPLSHQTVQTQTPADVLKIFDTTVQGLTTTQVSQRLLTEGPNEIPHRERGWFSILLRQYTTPLVALLAIAAAISFVLGEATDGLTIVGILVVNGFLGFVQEFRSARSLLHLQHFLKASAIVRRNGTIATIDRTNLVRGDIVLIKAGDEVPVDLRLIEATNLRLDESTLTGESIEVSKTSDPLSNPTPEIHLSSNVALSGTTVRQGEGEGIAIATGRKSVLGSIAHLVAETQHKSSFEQNLKQFSAFLIKVVAVSLAIVFATNILTKGESIHLSEQLLFALALAISVIPEALPAVTTITLSRGALQLARQHVVVKRLSAIEDLGHIDILCTDKTGTLTENRLAVSRLITPHRSALLHALLAGLIPSVRLGVRESGDPFDTALLSYAATHGHHIPENDVLRTIPFDPERRRLSTLVREHNRLQLIVRGAPETILPMCTTGLEGEFSFDAVMSRAEQCGQSGERVIAVAVRDVAAPIPENLTSLETAFTFLGLVAFSDPIKPTSRRALLDAERLGVEVKIVTGDSSAVAGAVATRLGIIRSPFEVITGEQLDKLSDPEYTHEVRRYRVFARMTPQQKFKLITSLQASAAVGFLGEGINDAPALKLATVSLVVNTASDVARGAADIVLVDKSLHVIIDGIRQGRTIFVNISKYLKYTLIGNFGNFFAIAGISLVINFLPMLPVQILLTNLLTDFPLVAVAGDNVDPKDVRRPPHFRLRELGFLTVTLGLVSALFDFIFFGLFSSQPPAVIQSLWFTESILTELLLIYSIRTTLPIEKSQTASASLLWLTLGAGVIAVLLPLSSFGQGVFHFVRPTATNLIIIAALVSTYFIVTETVKRLYYRQYRYHHERVPT